MPELPDVVPGATIQTARANQIRDRVIQRYASAAARDASVLIPVDGDVAWLSDTNRLTIYDGSAWAQWTRSPDSNAFSALSLSVPANGTGVSMDINGFHGAGIIKVIQTQFSATSHPDGFTLATISMPNDAGKSGRILVQGLVGGQDSGAAGFNVTGQGVTGNVGDRVTVDTPGGFAAASRWADVTLQGQSVNLQSNAPGINMFYRSHIMVIQL